MTHRICTNLSSADVKAVTKDVYARYKTEQLNPTQTTGVFVGSPMTCPSWVQRNAENSPLLTLGIVLVALLAGIGIFAGYSTLAEGA